MKKRDMLDRLDILWRCVNSLPDDVEIIDIMPQSSLCQGFPAIHLLHPLREFDARIRIDVQQVRYTRQRSDAWVYWITNEPLPEGV